MLVIVGVLSAYLDKNFSKDSKITILIMVAGGTILYEVGLYLLNMFSYEYDAEVALFSKMLAIEVIYNVIITLIIYGVIRKVGNIVERNFKEKNILTRYF